MREKYNLKIKLNMLICLMALVLGMTIMGAYASYTTTNSNGGDNANVAQFSVAIMQKHGETVVETETIEAYVTPNTDESVNIEIKNDSAVDIEYTLKVTNVTGNITPLSFNLKAKEGTSTPTPTKKDENGITTFSAIREAGSYTDEYILEIVWNPSVEEDYDLSFIGMVDYITIEITATSAE